MLFILSNKLKFCDMLLFISNLFEHLSFNLISSNIFSVKKLDSVTDHNNENIYAQLMLQFGSLVFFLSLVALAAPAYFGLYGSFILTFIPLCFSLLYAIITFVQIYNSSSMIFINGFKWFYLPGSLQVNFDLLIDKLSITYVSLILSIGLSVSIYTFSYFRYEPHVERLFLFINLFMISMCILVLGGNLFVLFLG